GLTQQISGVTPGPGPARIRGVVRVGSYAPMRVVLRLVAGADVVLGDAVDRLAAQAGGSWLCCPGPWHWSYSPQAMGPGTRPLRDPPDGGGGGRGSPPPVPSSAPGELALPEGLREDRGGVRSNVRALAEAMTSPTAGTLGRSSSAG